MQVKASLKPYGLGLYTHYCASKEIGVPGEPPDGPDAAVHASSIEGIGDKMHDAYYDDHHAAQVWIRRKRRHF